MTLMVNRTKMGFVFFYSIEKREKNLDCGDRELADVAKAKSACFFLKKTEDLRCPYLCYNSSVYELEKTGFLHLSLCCC